MENTDVVSIDPKNVNLTIFQSYLLGAVAPRPIAFASTVSAGGKCNLSPFSYFNAFSANPPILIFSPARRGRDNTNKHTLENVKEVAEVVINICNYDMVEQMSLSSTEYPEGVNEFDKSGLTMVKSEMIEPPRVGESPVAFECSVNEVIALGDQGGAGNLVVCEVLMVHIKKGIFDDEQRIDPRKLDAVGRMGGNWYVRANDPGLFEIAKPLSTMGIGVDAIPDSIRYSSILTGNDLGKLGNVEALPPKEEVLEMASHPDIRKLKEKFGKDPEKFRVALHEIAKESLNRGESMKAWSVLLQNI